MIFRIELLDRNVHLPLENGEESEVKEPEGEEETEEQETGTPAVENAEEEEEQHAGKRPCLSKNIDLVTIPNRIVSVP